MSDNSYQYAQEVLRTSVVRFVNMNKGVCGAGMLVTDKHIITCAHVIHDIFNPPKEEDNKPEKEQDYIEQPTGEILLDFPLLDKNNFKRAKVVKWPKKGQGADVYEPDVAALELLDDPPQGAEAVALLMKEPNFLWEHRFAVFGFSTPGGKWDGGKIKGVQVNGWLHTTKSDEGNIDGGFSGAPILDVKEGKVIGILKAIPEVLPGEEPDTAYIIPVPKIVASCPTILHHIFNPYKGLYAFNEQDAPYYFGREQKIKELKGEIESEPFVAVLVGNSGSGKSSLVSGWSYS